MSHCHTFECVYVKSAIIHKKMPKYPLCLVILFRVGMGGKIKEHFMNKIPNGLTIIYFDGKDKNIC